MITCKNCGSEFDSKYCPDCGQKAKTKRITTKAVYEEARQRLIHYDSGFVYTVIELLRRPGHAIREYIEGKRAPHFKPVKFILWTTALNFLVFHLIGLDNDMVQAMSEQQGKTEFSQKFTQYIFEHPAIMILLLIPNIALFSRWYFKRHGYNYAEHLVLNIYLVGELSLFGVVLNPLYKYTLSGPSFSFAQIWIQSLFSICFLGWGYVQFFQPKRKWLCWLKAMLAVLSGYVFMLIIISVLIALVIILFWPWLKPYFTG